MIFFQFITVNIIVKQTLVIIVKTVNQFLKKFLSEYLLLRFGYTLFLPSCTLH